MKYLYIVDYWVPFPSSEYGGMIVVIAENDIDCFNQLSEERAFDQAYQDRIMMSVTKAQKFVLADDYESGIVEAFTT
jgi:peptide methionine sulfoxide reductase MsrA